MKWLVDLRDGTVSPSRAADWAGSWLQMDNILGQHLEIQDRGAWEALKTLCGANLSGWPDREFLHGREDFIAWIEALEMA